MQGHILALLQNGVAKKKNCDPFTITNLVFTGHHEWPHGISVSPSIFFPPVESFRKMSKEGSLVKAQFISSLAVILSKLENNYHLNLLPFFLIKRKDLVVCVAGHLGEYSCVKW